MLELIDISFILLFLLLLFYDMFSIVELELPCLVVQD